MDAKTFWSMSKLEQFQFVVENCNYDNWPRYPFMPLVNHTVEPFSDDYCGFLLAKDIRTLSNYKVYVGMMFDANALLQKLSLRSISIEKIDKMEARIYPTLFKLAEIWKIDE